MLQRLVLTECESLNPCVLVPGNRSRKKRVRTHHLHGPLWVQAHGDSLQVHKYLLQRERPLMGIDGQPCGVALTRGSRVLGSNTSSLLREELEGAINSVCRKCFRRSGPTSAQRDGASPVSRAALALFLAWFCKEMGSCPSLPVFFPAPAFQALGHLELNMMMVGDLKEKVFLSTQE